MLDFLKWPLVGACAPGAEGAGLDDDAEYGAVFTFDCRLTSELYGDRNGFSVQLGDGDGSENFSRIKDFVLFVFHNAAHLSDIVLHYMSSGQPLCHGRGVAGGLVRQRLRRGGAVHVRKTGRVGG